MSPNKLVKRSRGNNPNALPAPRSKQETKRMENNTIHSKEQQLSTTSTRKT
jgi:hypothetical protein